MSGERRARGGNSASERAREGLTGAGRPLRARSGTGRALYGETYSSASPPGLPSSSSPVKMGNASRTMWSETRRTLNRAAVARISCVAREGPGGEVGQVAAGARAEGRDVCARVRWPRVWGEKTGSSLSTDQSWRRNVRRERRNKGRGPMVFVASLESMRARRPGHERELRGAEGCVRSHGGALRFHERSKSICTAPQVM